MSKREREREKKGEEGGEGRKKRKEDERERGGGRRGGGRGRRGMEQEGGEKRGRKRKGGGGGGVEGGGGKLKTPHSQKEDTGVATKNSPWKLWEAFPTILSATLNCCTLSFLLTGLLIMFPVCGLCLL